MNYVTRHPEGIMTDGPKQVQKIGLKAFINNLCLEHLSTYEGRQIAARKMLQRRNNVPIYVHNHMILIATHAIRHPACMFVNAQNVSHVQTEDNQTILWFLDGTRVATTITKSHLHLLLERAMHLGELVQ